MKSHNTGDKITYDFKGVEVTATIESIEMYYSQEYTGMCAYTDIGHYVIIDYKE